MEGVTLHLMDSSALVSYNLLDCLGNVSRSLFGPNFPLVFIVMLQILHLQRIAERDTFLFSPPGL